MERVDPHVAEPLAGLALAAIHREYPSQISHCLQNDRDARPPRELTPAFYGCYDWHSAVHGHWCLARLVRCLPQARFVPPARAALERSLTAANIAAEVAYLRGDGRPGFERPYGLAWLLQLAAELREWPDAEARTWHAALEPLEALAAQRLGEWLPKLRWPIRSGEHRQTAFAMGLAHDWARAAGERRFTRLIEARARDFYGADVSAPMAYEPSGHDFLSPILGEADLMRRVMPPPEFAPWLDRLLPDLTSAVAEKWLAPVASPDRADGKLAHLDGLNLSRAWMLEGIAESLPSGDPRLPALLRAAVRHREAGLSAVTGEHYAGAHWLASFAAYLLTGRGMPAKSSGGA